MMKESQYRKGYQDALSEIEELLQRHGIDAVRTWLENNLDHSRRA